MKKLSFFLLIIMSLNTCWGCEFDTDCNPGSKCLKSSGSMYGVCAGGISPGIVMTSNQFILQLILTAQVVILAPSILIVVQDQLA